MRVEISEEVFNPAFFPYLFDESRYLVLWGSASSGKSYFAAQKYIYRIMTEEGQRFLCVRKVAKGIRFSQFKLLKDVIKAWGLEQLFHIKEMEMEIIFKSNGNSIMSLGIDDPEKMKSIAGITGIWVEEASEMTQNDCEQLDLRLRTDTSSYLQIMYTFNPISQQNWLNNYFFVNPDPNMMLDTTVLHTDFRANLFNNEDYLRSIFKYRNTNPNYYNIYVLGKWGGSDMLVFPSKPLMMPLKEYPKDEDCTDIYYGLDFGFKHPMALYKIKEYQEM